jgi:DNA-directed RNA polymerase specialized sigma24 family protein
VAYAVLNALGVLLVLPRATTSGLGDDKDHENHEEHPAHGNECSAIPHSLARLAAADRRLRALLAALAELPDDTRQALLLVYGHGASWAKAAAEVGYAGKLDAFRRRGARAMARLRTRFGAGGLGRRR